MTATWPDVHQWHGGQTTYLRCRLCSGMFFLQDHSLYIPQADWRGYTFTVWTWLLCEPHYHIHSVSLFLHGDDQKLWLWITLTSASWKVTMFRRIDTLVLMLALNDGHLHNFYISHVGISPAAISPSQLISSCRRPLLKPPDWQVCGAWSGKPRWMPWGSWLW